MIRVFVSSYKAIHEPNEKLYYVYIIEVVNNGRSHRIERRYSSFLVLHKQVSTTWMVYFSVLYLWHMPNRWHNITMNMCFTC